MRVKLVLASILVVLFSTTCSKPESAVSQTDTIQPSAEAVEPMPDTAASTGTEAATGTITQTSVSTVSEQVTPPVAPAASAAKPVASTPPPATKTPPATASATATVAPATATTATATSATAGAAPAPAASAPPPATAAKPATRASSGKAPKTHTVDREGIKHAPGDDNATTKCATCHGKDLKGGKVAKVSCFECHDQNWK